MSKFWTGWLNIWCAFVVVFALVLMGAALPSTDGPARELMQLIGGRTAIGFDQPMRFGVGLMGAVSFGWGLTLWAIVRACAADLRLASRLLRPVTAAIAVWFVVDSAISVETGFALNVASNVLLMAGWLAPMIASGAMGRAPKGAPRPV